MAKTNVDFNIFRSLITLVRGERHEIFALIAYSLGVGICSLITPIAVQSLVNSVAFGTLLQPIVILSCIVGGVLLFGGALRILQLLIVEVIQKRLVVRLSLYLGNTLPHVLVEPFHRLFGPEYILRFTEVFAVQKVLALLLLDGIAIIFQVTAGLILVSFYHPFFLASAILILLGTFVVVFPLGYRGVRTSIEESSAKYEVAGWLQDIASVPTLFKSTAGELYAVQRTDSLLEEYLANRRSHFRVLLRHNIGALFLQIGGSALILFVGGLLVIKGELSLGQLVSAELIFSLILINITKTGKHLETYYDLCGSLQKLQSLTSLPYENISGDMRLPKDGPADLLIQKITATDTSSLQSLTLNQVSAHFPAGSASAILGSHGGGKTALANFIYRLDSPQSGWIEYDSVNITSLMPQVLRTQVHLTRDVEFFHGTLWDNLTLGRATDEVRARGILRELNLLEHIEQLPEGLKTVVRGSWGPLSHGKALLFMIARAVIAKPRLLIVDGTLDILDTKITPHVIRVLKGYAASTTLIVLTNESSIANSFPHVFTLRNGELEAQITNNNTFD